MKQDFNTSRCLALHHPQVYGSCSKMMFPVHRFSLHNHHISFIDLQHILSRCYCPSDHKDFCDSLTSPLAPSWGWFVLWNHLFNENTTVWFACSCLTLVLKNSSNLSDFCNKYVHERALVSIQHWYFRFCKKLIKKNLLKRI